MEGQMMDTQEEKIEEKTEEKDEQKQKSSKKRWKTFFHVFAGFIAGAIVMSLAAMFYISKETTILKEQLILKYIDQYYLKEVDEQALEDGKFKGMVEALGDEYSTYYTVEETTARTQQYEGTYKGIGVVLSQNQETKVLTVTRCYPGSPAEAAGILPGDILEQVNGNVVSDMELNDVVSMIKESGDEGAVLLLIREGETAPIEITVVPSTVQYPVVESQMLEDGIGYMAVYDFTATTYEQFHTQLEDLKNQGMTRLIVDLRNNTGGLMLSVTAILDSILPKGVMVYTVDKDGKRTEYVSSGQTPLEIPMVVLVNEYTASASEIFAGAVQDYDMAQLVGTTTYGKGVVQNTIYLEDGSAVKLTSSSYYTPNGTSIHGNGLEPDVEVELNKEVDEDGYIHDNQLEKAIEVVKTME